MTSAGMLKKLIIHVTKGAIPFNRKEKPVNKNTISSLRFNNKGVKVIEARAKEEDFGNNGWVFFGLLATPAFILMDGSISLIISEGVRWQGCSMLK